MNGTIFRSCLVFFIVAAVFVPVSCAVNPLWIVSGPESGELTTVAVSQDGSTVVAGGDQLITLSRDGKKLWTGWSGTKLVVSRDGNYILTTRDQNVRLISGSGRMLWDDRLDVPVSEVAMTPDASLILAGGANIIRLIGQNGSGIRQNRTMPVMNHFRFFQSGNGVVVTSQKGIQTSNLTFFSNWTDTNMTQEYVETDAGDLSFVSVTNNRIRFYRLGENLDGTLEWERALPGGNTLGFALSRDGSVIVVGRDDNTIQVLDRYGNLLWTDRASHWVTSVAVSDDGNTIVAGSMDKTVAVYDRAGTKLGTAVLKNAIRSGSVATSGDGSVIAAVDGSAVYGFSRSQFSQPAPAGATTEPTVREIPPSREVVTTLPVTLPTPAATAKAAPFQGILPAALFLFIAWRSWIS
ncbi:WD40 repeat domain-containing protein [Methanoregula sp. PtaB.Bin085]|uniref:WD40 repeat domain-containing protein n=1 Tax=Methanoregula sp. PtaB.Bin085 TaxID=1811680 RepID=UPI0009CAFE75|nr:WD40 repeat domain-containing protein [Methanoregula sp. PtaB.Bin085]OPX64437.1 MAG: WD domain, G-beta repeat [Methanoregula sp. PtaB.Bin085]